MTDIAARLAITMDWLCKAVAARGGRDRSVTPLIVLLWGRLRRTAYRLDILLARFRAGTLPKPRLRPQAKRARPVPAESPPDPPGAPQTLRRLPQGFGWLGQFIPFARPFGGQLEHLLTDPEMVAFLTAAPQAKRLLRPVLWMLGVKPGPLLTPPPRGGRPRPKTETSPTPTPPTPINAPGPALPDPAMVQAWSAQGSATTPLRFLFKRHPALAPMHVYFVALSIRSHAA